MFRVGLTRDFLKPDGSLAFQNIGLDVLEGAPGITWDFLPPLSEPTLAPSELQALQVRDYDALLVLGARVSSATLAGNDRLVLVARFGVGYDNVDVPACTRAGVLLTITPDGVRRPVATSVLAFMLALSLRMFDKDHLTRDGRWADKVDHMGTGLTGRTLGIIGLGNIGREIVRLASPLGMRHLTFDPYLSAADAATAGVEQVDLETLLRVSDVVSINCALTPQTHHLLNAERLALMKPTAYLINTARGPIVDQRALTEALAARRLAGAALDVFDTEPVDPTDPLLKADNVIVAPHAICWTDECFTAMGESACRSIVEVAAGRIPSFVVNSEALRHPRVRERLS
ncbi:MAG: dehydrogenase [Chloroflexota bacterium]|nr:dehydrogenase [Chloroflexota bacterium]